MTATAVLALSTIAVAHSPYNLISDGGYDNAKDTHAHEAQHGGDEGHLDPINTRNLDVLSVTTMSRITEGGIADLAIKGNYAYLNSWGGAGNCGRNGVHVVDISNLSAPVEVGFIQSKQGSYPGEGAQVVSLDTASFTGDVLLTNNEICKAGVGFGGINLYDVTDPTEPEKLAVGFGDYDDNNNKKKYANQVHSVFAWQDGDKAYAVMVDNEEFEDVDIVDITDPRKPVLIAEHDLVELSGEAITQPGEGLDEVFLHDMVVKEIDDGTQVMIASYWDGGYVTLDVDDPVKPVLLADSDLPLPFDSEPVYDTLEEAEAKVNGKSVPPEGNAHQAEFTLDNKFVVGADEDFSPFALNAGYGEDGTPLEASPGSDTPQLADGETLEGTAVYAGRACTGDQIDPAPEAKEATTYIAVVERGICPFTEKVANVFAAGGYAAVLVINRTGAGFCDETLGMSVEGALPTFGVAPRSQGLALFGEKLEEGCVDIPVANDKLANIALGVEGTTVAFESYFDGWGYVRLFNAETMEELDSYAVPESRTDDYATGYGDLSVHEVATSQQDAGLAYLSYYAAGLRVIEVGDDGITEVGAFIDKGGNNFWGVEVFERDGEEYVALSDRDKGLYIMKYTP